MLTKRHVNRPIFTKKKKKKNPAKIGKCYQNKELPWCLSGKESACTSGDVGSVPGWGTSPGEGKSNPLQCSCLGNPMGRGAWQTAGHNKTIKKAGKVKTSKKIHIGWHQMSWPKYHRGVYQPSEDFRSASLLCFCVSNHPLDLLQSLECAGCLGKHRLTLYLI